VKPAEITAAEDDQEIDPAAASASAALERAVRGRLGVFSRRYHLPAPNFQPAAPTFHGNDFSRTEFPIAGSCHGFRVGDGPYTLP
jgi:hypothetical protein